MTIDYDKLAGRELDALIAVVFYNWRWMSIPMREGQRLTGIFPPDAPGRIPIPNGLDQDWLPSNAEAPRWGKWDQHIYYWDDGEIQGGDLTRYSTDINPTWQALEEHFPWPNFHTRLVRTNTGRWRCEIEIRIHYGDYHWVSAECQSAPLAICRAMLKAKEAGA